MKQQAAFRHSDSLTLAQKRAFGPLLRLIDEPGTRDILMQSAGRGSEVWVDRGDGLKKLTNMTVANNDARRIAVDLISSGGRHLDELEPCADVNLGEGIRVHAVLTPVVREAIALSIRLPSGVGRSLMDLFRSGLCDTQTAKRLIGAVANRKNILITGATASGKTTLLSALLSEADPGERIISIEDVAEIKLTHPHHVSLESRQANSEGIGEINLDRLLREVLRMRPDRIVLGECRGAEIATLLTALNTGHDGGASTLHARSIEDIPPRLEALGALAGMSPEALARQTVSAIDLAVHIVRRGAKHSIEALGVFTLGERGTLQIEVL